MEETLMGWTSYQWRIVERALGRRQGSLNMHYASSQLHGWFADAQAEWQKRFKYEPGQQPLPKVERKMMNERVDFGFDCKVTTMGWREDFMRGGHVYELRVRVGGASFGSCQFVDMTRFMMARDDGFLRAVERKAVEEIKRAVVDKMFPNL